ncbi:(E3-independent) E2 ubiquitin-conjugating enzyme [Ranunculus cassubicifolius]
MKDFQQFDSVTDASDHHFVGSNLKGKEYKENVMKKIMQEWKILEKNLPESIFVRVYEDRIDLLRAVIVGPPGTPYYNGLFFFDFCFPKNYPSKPPTVFYHSFGMRLNPNLYESGTVCLSLLNTWFGRKEQKWNSSDSTVLQVLLSLQALVLNEQPYFNEPGRGKLAGKPRWEKTSMAYNENIWVMTCKTMRLLLRRPPKHFEEFINEYFREQAQSILFACKAYVDGRAKVGHVVQNGISSSSTYQASKTFKTSMRTLCPLLLESFELKGAPVENFKAELIFTKVRPEPVVQRKKDGMAKKIVSKLKKIFVWKKKTVKDLKKHKTKIESGEIEYV